MTTPSPHPAEPATREAARRLPLDRPEHEAGRGPAPPGRPGPLHRRRRAAEHAARGGRSAARTPTRGSSRSTSGRAKALPGVVAVMTGADVAKVTGPLPCFANPPVEQRCVALDRVRHVGEPVAIVAAESRYLAEDALELIEVDYEALPAVVDPEAAISATGDAVLHPERGPTNVALHRNFSFGPLKDDFANADVVIRRKLRWPRSGAQPLETCGAVAAFDRGAGKFTVHVNSSMYNYVGWSDRRHARRPGAQAQHRADARRRQLRQQAFSPQGAGDRRDAGARRPAARSNTSRTGSTTSPPATITARTGSTRRSWLSTKTAG